MGWPPDNVEIWTEHVRMAADGAFNFTGLRQFDEKNGPDWFLGFSVSSLAVEEIDILSIFDPDRNDLLASRASGRNALRVRSPSSLTPIYIYKIPVSRAGRYRIVGSITSAGTVFLSLIFGRENDKHSGHAPREE